MCPCFSSFCVPHVALFSLFSCCSCSTCLLLCLLLCRIGTWMRALRCMVSGECVHDCCTMYRHSHSTFLVFEHIGLHKIQKIRVKFVPQSGCKPGKFMPSDVVELNEAMKESRMKSVALFGIIYTDSFQRHRQCSIGEQCVRPVSDATGFGSALSIANCGRPSKPTLGVWSS